MKIAIQGGLGSFHHQAASMLFDGDSYEILDKDHFRGVAEALVKGECTYGLIALENSIAGCILPNYNLIKNNDLKIVGELYMPIEHHLMVIPGVKIEDLSEIYSHSMALLQCEDFLNQYPKIRRIDYVDTANSAKKIKTEDLHHAGAIGSKVAAELYGLEIIKPAIQSNKDNYTRFVLLCRELPDNQDFNKISLRFSLPHQKGSLANILMQFAVHGFNMTKIQSMPIVDMPWQYEFYVDVIVHHHERFAKVLDIIQLMAEDIEILGKYKNGNL
ncbi:prephenate dehydratase [Ornithobacterium rhinotracheale]|uniref:prephenate dehydratase n=1 Tax=Ornithobacterium rhinotracheale TaxID=28251 RepID=UPI00129CD793|nr:prephenate dehydratase [Ornithobacterium rhinotracheale]MRJ07301.1 prephenate dehydratase [Ornithobacterium rhinotracheale]UOH77903.1 prephenate dehydratase [Ornithobacterium rhinotracheale]